MSTHVHKNNSNKIITIIVLLLITIVSIGMIFLYPSIKKSEQKYKSIYLGAHGEIPIMFTQFNYGLYTNFDEKNKQIIDKQTDAEFAKLSEMWLNELRNEYKSIEYYAKDIQGRHHETNINDPEEKTAIDKFENDKLEKRYNFFLIIKYDEQGNLSTELGPQIDSESFEEGIQITDQTIRANEGRYQSPITNMFYFYGLPKQVRYIDDLSQNMEVEMALVRTVIVNKFIYIVSIIMTILAMLFPYRQIIKLKWFKIYLKVPLELVVISIGYIVLTQLGTAPYMIEEYLNNEITIWIGIYLGDIKFSPLFINVLNFLSWIIYFSALLLIVWTTKMIRKEGMKLYIQKHTLVYKIYLMIQNGVNNTAQKISGINIHEVKKNKILKIIVKNTFTISICCLFWFFGVIGVLIYAIIIYKILRRAFENISTNYEKLFKSTSHLAEGVLDEEMVQEDLGIFEPLKCHIQKIQHDFRRSVEEEVRSQKMKTELITNVSHDLRTPLTSIISYIDLLKQENLTEDTKRQYIDVLDKKALRLQILIEDLFEMSKASSGDIRLNLEQVDIVALIKQVLFELEDKIKSSDIMFRTTFSKNKIYALLDNARSFRVFDNLFNNIIKYAMPHSRAYIEVSSVENEVYIILKNVARQELDFKVEDITERFVRGDESRNTEGSGLGLAIAKSFVQLQGGSFNIYLDGDLFKVVIKFDKL